MNEPETATRGSVTAAAGLAVVPELSASIARAADLARVTPSSDPGGCSHGGAQVRTIYGGGGASLKTFQRRRTGGSGGMETKRNADRRLQPKPARVAPHHDRNRHRTG